MSLFLLILLAWQSTTLVPCRTPQKVTTKVSVYDDIFFSEAGLIPLPANAIELEHTFAIQSKMFRYPIKIDADSDGNIYASDRRNGAVYKYDVEGDFKLQIGRDSSRKEQLRAPYDLLVGQKRLIIHDTKKGRLEYYDLEGNHTKSQKISDPIDIVGDEYTGIYAAHHIQDRDSPLVNVYLPDGRKAAFGKPLFFTHSMQVLNSRSLALNENGDLFVAFTYFPIVRKYSSRGELLAEYRIENPTMEAKENYNLKIIGRGTAIKTQRVGYKAIIIDIEWCDEKLYLLGHVPRLEIIEMDGDGNISATFWKDFQEVYETNDLLVQRIEGKLRFCVSHSSPPTYKIDFYGKKIKKYQGGLKGEIEQLTEEIQENPEYFTAYNNRGIARHRLGDYQGAIEDLTKAIQLRPESPLAYNNRGLSKVKIKDLKGAVEDFTVAVRLDPKNGSTHFNRGIALVLTGSFAEAIRDFEKAAVLDDSLVTKAQEQIRYCRNQIKRDA